jgi:hypothetical protein
MAALNWKTSSVEDAQARMTADPGLFGRVQGELAEAYNEAVGYDNPDRPTLDTERLAFQQRAGEAGNAPARLLIFMEARDHFVGRAAAWAEARKQEQQRRFQMAHEARMWPQQQRMREDRAVTLSGPLNAACQELAARIAAVQGRFLGVSEPADLVPLADELEAAMRAARETLATVRREAKAKVAA